MNKCGCRVTLCGVAAVDGRHTATYSCAVPQHTFGVFCFRSRMWADVILRRCTVGRGRVVCSHESPGSRNISVYESPEREIAVSFVF